MVGLGSLAGPFLGGVLVNAFSWPSIFLINIPIAIFGAVMAFFVMPAHEETSKLISFDGKGTAFYSAAMLVLFLTLLLAQQGILPAIWLIPAVVIAVLCLWGFVHTERHSPDPLIHMHLFRKMPFTLGLMQGFFIFIALSATLMFMPFYLQDVLKYGPLHAGIIIAVYPIVMAIFSPISGRLADRMSTRPLTALGTGLSAAALILLAFTHVNTPIWVTVVGLAVLGLGNGLFQSPNNTDIFNSVPLSQLGIAGGINALFRNIGFVAGTSFSVLIFSFTAGLDVNSISGNMDNNAFMQGFAWVFVFCGICSVIAFLLCFMRVMKKGTPSDAPDSIKEQ